MLGKNEILVVLIGLLLTFYLVIVLAAGGKSKNPLAAALIKKYLFGVRILIGFLAIVSLILWLLS